MKFSLISATSILALFAASLGPAHSAALSATEPQQNIFDLVHDGMTSSDGGDNTVTAQDPMVTAVIAFEASVAGLQAIRFTGQVDQVAASGGGYPKIPLGAARGAEPDEALAMATTGTTPTDAMEKARAIGQMRMASLIGTVGTGPTQKDAAGETVFMANISKPTFDDGGDMTGPGGASSTFAFAPSSTSTATATLAGTGNLARQWAGTNNYVVAANSLQAAPTAQPSVAKGVDLLEAAQPTLGYNYAPTVNSATKGNEIQASFSDAMSAAGDLAQVVTPLTVAQAVTAQTFSGQRALPGDGRTQTSETTGRPGRSNEIMTSQNQRSRPPSADGSANGKTQTSQIQPVTGRSNEILTSQIQRSQFQALESASTKKPADLVEALLDPNDGQQGDGTRTFLSTSVSANPSESAATYLASVIRRTPVGATSASVEAFEVGPTPGAKTTADATTTVPAPLGGKILASVGPLNSALALP